MRPLPVPEGESVEAIPLRPSMTRSVVNSLDLHDLRQHDTDEALAILKGTVAESVAQHDRAIRELQWERHGDAPSIGYGPSMGFLNGSVHT
jgi:hypothetical protein